jgi:hypothetical protein
MPAEAGTQQARVCAPMNHSSHKVRRLGGRLKWRGHDNF